MDKSLIRLIKYILTEKFSPSKGFRKQDNSYKTQPSIQISVLKLYFSPEQISGERKYGVPKEVLA